MNQKKVANLLLLVIAVCLVLIVANLYGVSFAQPVEAEQGHSGREAVGVVLMYEGRDSTLHPLADQYGRIACKTGK